MRKIIVLFLTLFGFTVFFGCGAHNSSKKITTITLWHYFSAGIKTRFDAQVQEFNETVGKKKGIMIDAYSQGGVNELANAVFAAANKDIGAKPMPNIFAAYSDNVFRLDKLNVIAELDEYFTKKEIALFRKEFIEDGNLGVDKKLKIIPIAKSTELLFINATAFNEFAAKTGVTYKNLETWEGLVKTAEIYYNWSGGNALFGIDSMANFMNISSKQLGGDIITVTDDKTHFTLSLQNAKKIWNIFYVPFINGHISVAGRFRSDGIKAGNIIMFIGSNSSASFFPRVIETGKNSSYSIESAVLPFPYFEGQKRYSVHQGPGMVVSKSDKNTELACAEFLKWFTSPEQNLDFAVATAYLPVVTEALSYEKTVQKLATQDKTDVLVQTARAVYNMLDSHELYALPPFEKSFEARKILDASLLSFAQDNLKKIAEQTAAGKSRSAMVRIYSSESTFMQWYDQLSDEMGNLFK